MLSWIPLKNSVADHRQDFYAIAKIRPVRYKKSSPAKFFSKEKLLAASLF
jgi:hypothetical protein